MTMNFKTILYRISLSDEAAFRELFEHFFPGLLSFCISILKNQHLAEEVVEDVFIKLWENRKTATVVRNISLYLYKAVRYASINALEKKKKYESISLDEVGESFTFTYAMSRCESSLISKENCLKIAEAVSQLPPKCRLIFRLIKDEGMKYKEVSQLLNLSEKTVENQMNIAFKKLIEKFNVTIPELMRTY
ncbi:MAG: RNA polymerase sigma-70 factor [Niabella sp.]